MNDQILNHIRTFTVITGKYPKWLIIDRETWEQMKNDPTMEKSIDHFYKSSDGISRMAGLMVSVVESDSKTKILEVA